jgi:hypothetical protein
MKNKLLSSVIIITGLISLFAGCKKDRPLGLVEDDTPSPALTIYAIGNSVGWSSDEPTAMLKRVGTTDDYILDTLISYNAENKQFKFITEKGAWDKIHYLVPATVDYHDPSKPDDPDGVKILTPGGTFDMILCSQLTGDLQDHFWGIKEADAGNYHITVNVKTMKLKFEKN